MATFTKESLEHLRQRINVVDVISSHIELKRTGAAYKALCPFHDEKTASFTIQNGDTHYHCFGCGAHGDAIQFLMTHLKMSFFEAVESLAEKFHVPLEKTQGAEEKKGPSKTQLKEALEASCQLYHLLLLHTQEGHEVLQYLYKRGIDLDFIRYFQVGLALNKPGLLRKVMHAKFIKDETLIEAGLLSNPKDGYYRDFFYDRITFPIRDPLGSVIGFSARKYKDGTYGGKYVNTPETPLFKKSKVLFGLNYCRKRISKERCAIIVEGQIDALRLIQSGFNITVAGQGTAFGDGHVKELLLLGINLVYLALDGDEAGLQATCKIGNLFQKDGVEVRIVPLPEGKDPDLFLKEQGAEAFVKLMEDSLDYLTFLVRFQSRSLNINSPAGKNQLVQQLAAQIRSWDHPLMVHESLRKLAHLAQVPENVVGVGSVHTPNLYIKKNGSIGQQSIDPDRIIETDFLRWLILMGESQPHFVQMAELNISKEALRLPSCRHIYEVYLSHRKENKPSDLLTLTIALSDAEAQLLLSDLLHKRVNRDRAELQYVESMQKILDRNWMEAREVVKMRIQSGQCNDDEVLELVKQFDHIKKTLPKVRLLSE